MALETDTFFPAKSSGERESLLYLAGSCIVLTGYTITRNEKEVCSIVTKPVTSLLKKHVFCPLQRKSR